MTSSPVSRLDKREAALAAFVGWFRDNYPGPNTIISKPDWHAPKVFRAVEYALQDAGLIASESASPVTPSHVGSLSEFVHAPKEVKEAIGNEVAKKAIERQQATLTASSTRAIDLRGTFTLPLAVREEGGERWIEDASGAGVPLADLLSRINDGSIASSATASLSDAACYHIFMDFDQEEVAKEPPSIQRAWSIGADIFKTRRSERGVTNGS